MVTNVGISNLNSDFGINRFDSLIYIDFRFVGLFFAENLKSFGSEFQIFRRNLGIKVISRMKSLRFLLKM
jgi:hypothetical protein